MVTLFASLRLLVAIALVAAVSDPGNAQDGYPNRSIKIVTPFAAGGIVDVIVRLVGEQLQIKWHQAVIVESRPGASGNLGAEAVARADPDGYTLLAAPPPPLAINQKLFRRLSFDPSALVPITILATAPNILVTNPNIAASSTAELISFAKAHPDKLSYASTGSGGTPHLTAEMFKAETGVQMVHVPYKGVPPAFIDLLSGQVDLMFANLGDSLQHVRSGKFKAIGVGSRQRVPALPDVPSISETVPDFVSETWFAVVAPPSTPPEIVAKLSNAIQEALQVPEVANALRGLLVTPVGSSPTVTGRFIKQEAERWGKVIETSGIKQD